MSQEDRWAESDRLHDEGRALNSAGDSDGALRKYFAALELQISRSNTHYNIGLIYKYRGAWKESFRFNKRAHELAPDDEAAAWNLAIAATALRDWGTARTVWNSLGLPVEPGTEPISKDFGLTPIRLKPIDDGEVVWARRIDPVRARICNIPYSGSGCRYGDVVLHDGAAVGYRMNGERECPVFNMLDMFEESRYSTFEADVIAKTEADAAALEAICDRDGVAFEDWSQSVQVICKACSEGRPHDHDVAERPSKPWNAERRIALAAESADSVESVLQEWASAERSVVGWQETLSPTTR
jgi:tetratricopeptide (TPR) repeat protein